MSKITTDMTLGDIMEKHPEVVDTLLSFGVHCVGCHASPFEPLGMGLASHGMSQEQIDDAVKKLNEVVEQHEKKEDNSVTLTDNAVKKIQQLLPAQNKEALRIGIKKGGCSGFSYVFDLADSKSEKDIVLEQDGVKVYITEESLQMIAGSEIDYLDSLQGAGFKVSNPMATANCGCGKSFR